jgi:Holliday junction resolvasome RuvABC endonuclease subunit
VRERDSAARLAEAEDSVEQVYRGLDDSEDATPSHSADVLAIAVCLRRMIEASRPFVAT